MRKRWLWGAGVAAWIVAGSGAAVEQYLTRRLVGAYASLPEQLSITLPRYLVWAALTPAVLLLCRRFPMAGPRRLRNAGLHLAGAAGYTALHAAALAAWGHAAAGGGLLPGWAPVRLSLLGYLPADLLVYGTLAAGYHAVAFHRAYTAREVKDAQLQARLAQAELDGLRGHLQPRFLFESLDAVSGLMDRDVRRCRKALADLSDLLRVSLQEGEAPPVPLADELAWLERYLALRTLGREQPAWLDARVEPGAEAALVPRMLLQPIVEGALGEDGVPACVEVRATTAGGTLRLEVRTATPRGSDAPAPVLTAAGERLRALHGVDVSERAGPGGTTVEMRLPLRVASPG